MAIRALSALAAAVILSTASSSWGQNAPGAGDDATGPDATLGDQGADSASGNDDAGADDSGTTSSGSADDSGGPIDPGIPSIPSGPNLPSYPVGVPTAPTSLPVPGGGASDQTSAPQETNSEPTTVHDGPSAEAGPPSSPSWGDAAPAAKQVQGLFPPDDGCGGCSTGDTGKSGPMVLVLAALVVAWRSRRR